MDQAHRRERVGIRVCGTRATAVKIKIFRHGRGGSAFLMPTPGRDPEFWFRRATASSAASSIFLALSLGRLMTGMRIENSAKAVIIEDDAILLIRYRDSTEMGLGDWYSLPGGRQRFGETVAEALVRECREEIGAEVRPRRLLFVREYIHARHELAAKGRDQHKVEFIFQCSMEPRAGKASDTDQTSAEWVKLEQVPWINVFPTALRHVKELIADTPETYWEDVY